MGRSALEVAVFAVGLIVVSLGVSGLALELPSFWDPCMSWGQGSSGNETAGLSPDDDCPTRSGTSQTKAQAAARLALVNGTAIVASGLALVGAWRRRAAPTLAAGLLMAGETVVLFFGLSIAFVLSLPASILFLVAAARWRRPPAARSIEAGTGTPPSP